MSFLDDDARHDAEQELLLRQWRGDTIIHPHAWVNRTTYNILRDALKRRRAERAALELYERGDRTDLYGKEAVPTDGVAYREYLREQKRRARHRRREAAA